MFFRLASILALIIFLLFWGVTSTADSTILQVTIEAVCGDNVVQSSEDCEGVDLNSQTCVSQGFSSGTLSCNADCTFNTAQCVASATPVTPTGGGTSGGSVGLFRRLINRLFPSSIPVLTSPARQIDPDFNADGQIDIVDLSILLYHFGQPMATQYDFNGDGLIDLIDLSVLFFYWTD